MVAEERELVAALRGTNMQVQYDRLELKQSKLLYLSSETSPEASRP